MDAQFFLLSSNSLQRSGSLAATKYLASENSLSWKLFYGAQVHTTILYPFTLDEFRSLHAGDAI